MKNKIKNSTWWIEYIDTVATSTFAGLGVYGLMSILYPELIAMLFGLLFSASSSIWIGSHVFKK